MDKIHDSDFVRQSGIVGENSRKLPTAEKIVLTKRRLELREVDYTGFT